jgi:hypothetical protein
MQLNLDPASSNASDGARFKQARLLLRSMAAMSMEFVGETHDDTVVRLRRRLYELAEKSESTARAAHWLSAYNLLGRQGDVFKRSILNSMRSILDEQIEAPFRTRTTTTGASRLKGMTLIDMSEMDRTVLIDRVARPLNSAYEEELAPLSHRCGLLVGAEEPELIHNPFRPEIFVRGFMQGWEMAGLDSHATEDLLLSLGPKFFYPLDTLYLELDSRLIKAKVAPLLKLRVKKARDVGVEDTPDLDEPTGSHGGSGEQGEGFHRAGKFTGDPDGAGIRDHGFDSPGFTDSIVRIGLSAKEFIGKLSSLLSKPLFGGADDDPAKRLPAPDPQFVDFLDSLQAKAASEPPPLATPAGPSPSLDMTDEMPEPEPEHENVLRSMAGHEEVQRAPELDRGTVDALAEVFDYVFSDEAIPSQLKVVIGRLQIPILKAAMIDREFFFKTEHPARKLVDSLSRASVAWTPDKGLSDPLYQKIEGTVQRVLSDFQEDLTLFADLLAEFERFLFENEQQVAARIEPQAVDATTNEQFELALRTADEFVHSRVAGKEIDPLLTPFLATQWREVLGHAWLNRERRPDVWDLAVETMDQLIWSVQPKGNQEERRQLVSILPGMVRNLNVALDAIRWHGEERSNFTKRLIESHTRQVRVGLMSLDHSATVTQADEAAAANAIHALDARRSSQSAQEDQYDTLARSLTRHTWFDFHTDDGAARRYRLSWISPMRTRLLFTNREGHNAFVHSERDVAKMLRNGRLSVVETASIVGRALDALLGDDLPETLSLSDGDF